MVNIYDKKNNVPYYIVGSLATLALLASGVFAAAPAILTALPSLEFLAPVVTLALSLGTPLIAVCAVFSVVTIAFSAIAIKKNRTISEKDTELANKTKKIEAKDKTLSEKGIQLAEKDIELKDKDVIISYVDKQLAGKDVVIAEQEAQLTDKTKEIGAKDKAIAKQETQLAENVRKIKSQSKFVIDSYINGQPLREKRRVNKAAVEGDMHLGAFLNSQEIREARKVNKAAVEGDMHLENLFSNTSAESEPDIQQAESTKAVSKQAEFLNIITTKYKESNWLSTTKTQTLGALSLMASYSVLYHLFNQVSSDISLDNNNSTGVDDLHNDSFPILEAGIGATFGFMGLVAQYFTGSIASALSLADNSINTVNDHINLQTTLEAAKRRAKEDFGVELKDNPCYTIGSNVLPGFVCNDRTTDYVTPPIQTNGTVEQNISTSVSFVSMIKGMLFSLFNTTYNPVSYTNGITGSTNSSNDNSPRSSLNFISPTLEEHIKTYVDRSRATGSVMAQIHC